MAYTTITTGTTITSSWANADVRDQVIVPFASTGARSSAITSPVTGQVSTLTTNLSTEGIYQYNSAGQWRAPWNLPWGAVVAPIELVGSQTGITSAVDITSGAFGTFTAVANRYYRIVVNVNRAIHSTATGNCNILVTDATPTTIVQFSSISTASGSESSVCQEYTATTTAGSKSWKLRVSGTASTISINGARIHACIYDAGPAGAPA